MTASATSLRDLPRKEWEAAIDHAASCLRGGRLVVMPTDTVYGVAASGASPEAIELLERATGDGMKGAPRSTWHLASLSALLEAVRLDSRVHRRLVTRLLPGPVRFVIEQPADVLEGIRRETGMPPGLVDDGSVLSVRVPGHDVACAVLERAGVPVVADRLGAAEWWTGQDAGRTVGSVPLGEAGGYGVAAVLDDGPTVFGNASTAVRLGPGGRFEVLSGGTVEERQVLDALDRTVLFVCSGNTCRSPMAEAIARELLRARPEDGITTRVLSAGTSATDGAPVSDGALEAMRKAGLDVSEHRSRRLTRDLIAQAEVIFTMTPAHADAVLRLDPEAAPRIVPLDPDGVVDDPFGMPTKVYERTAERLKELIARRLEELDR